VDYFRIWEAFLVAGCLHISILVGNKKNLPSAHASRGVVQHWRILGQFQVGAAWCLTWHSQVDLPFPKHQEVASYPSCFGTSGGQLRLRASTWLYTRSNWFKNEAWLNCFAKEDAKQHCHHCLAALKAWCSIVFHGLPTKFIINSPHFNQTWFCLGPG